MKLKIMFVAIVVVVPALAVQGNGIPAFEKTTADAAGTTNTVIRVGTCNVRVVSKKDTEEGNGWNERKGDLIALLRRLDMDVFGFQEIHTRPYRELCEGLKEWKLVDDYEDRKSVV